MHIFLFIITLFFSPALMAQDENIDWKTINTSGLYQKGDDNLIARDIWEDYTQERALKTLTNYPSSLHSSAYRSLMLKILLADSRPVEDDEVETPDLLSKRLEMLLQYGLFDDAEALYQSVEQNIRQKDFGLSLIGLQLTLKNGDLAPACLDIQAATTQFRDMPAWRELAQYCKLRFGANEKIDSSALSFSRYPAFNHMLADNIRDFSSNLSVLETLVAFSDDQISRSSYHNAARTISKQSDLFVKLALHKKFQNFKTRQCFVIEAVTRGLIEKEELSQYYEEVSFKDDDLTGKNQAIKIHPCDVPAFFYQRFTKSGTENITDADLSAFLGATESMSPHALAPFADHLTNFNYDDRYIWRAGIIMSLMGTEIPNHELLLPLIAIQESNQISEKDAKNWFEALKNSELHDNLRLDPATPFYYLRTLSGDFSKFSRNRDNFDYENLFPLTYGEKSLHSGLGKIDTMSAALRNDDVVRLFLLGLSQAGQYKPNNVHPEEIAGILSSLHKYKLKKEKDILAIDALHR